MRPPAHLSRASVVLLAACILSCGTHDKHAITGTVTGASAVTVSLTGAATRTTTTDGAGGYAFTMLADGVYAVAPEKAGYTFTPASLAVTVAGADVAGQDFAAAPMPRAITGAVTGASAVAVSLTGAATRTTTTDGNGAYAFTGLPDGAYVVTPEKAGYTFAPASLEVTVAGGDVAGQDFTATPVPHAITGAVTGASAVTVNLTGAATRATTTDGAGGYAFTGLADGTYAVAPEKAGYTFTPASLAVTVAGADVAGQDFTATLDAHAISGEVTCRARGVLSAISFRGATVALTGAATATTTTGGSGAYAFSDLPDGAYSVTPASGGYTFTPSSLAVPVSGADVTGANFAGAPLPIMVSGRVTGVASARVVAVRVCAGSPAICGSCDILCIAESAVTDANGDYSMTLPGWCPIIPAAYYRVSPSVAGYYFTPESRAVYGAGGLRTGLDFVAMPSRAIRGKVTGASDVEVKIAGPTAVVSAIPDSAGNYAITELRDGSYTLTPAKAGYTFAPANRSVTVSGADVDNQDFEAVAVPP